MLYMLTACNTFLWLYYCYYCCCNNQVIFLFPTNSNVKSNKTNSIWINIHLLY